MTHFEVIKDEINKWDPMGLLNIAPQDEYFPEIKKIAEGLHSQASIDGIASLIKDTFTEYFGELFNLDYNSCRQVAERIYKRLGERS
jgi:hypothetical protein